jgi:hypothetical protein
MKRVTPVIIILALMMSIASCSEYRLISIDRLPETARRTLDEYFPGGTPLVVKQETNEYEVVFEGGRRIEFDARGNWKEIDCVPNAVPDGLLPKEIMAKVHELYPETCVVKAERDRRGYSVKLNNRVGLEFNMSYVLTDIDTD